MTRPRVVVVGLGPAGPELIAGAVLDAARRIPARFLRTARHPGAAAIGEAASFDWAYEAAGTLEEVYPRIVEALVMAATRDGEVLYAVPGSPMVAERTVELLRLDDRVDVQVLPALSFLDLVWARLGVDPVAYGVRLIDGQRFATEAAGERGPLLVGQCDDRMVLSAIKLAVADAPEAPVTVLQRLGLPDEAVFEVAWDDLDRSFEPDHLTSLWVPQLASPVGAELVGFAELVRTLRQQCPWDREQTHHSLTRHLLEESYEVLEAIEALGAEGEGADEADPDAVDHLAEELGDLLFQVYFHATIAAEEGWFDLADVARGIHDKLVRRHPHVFSGVRADDTGAVLANWEKIKQAEKGRASIMDGIAGNLPALAYAHKVQRKAASVGFDWDDVHGAFPKVAEESGELAAAIEAGDRAALDHELGDLLFATVNVARHLDVDPEAALRAAAARFRSRFVHVEALAAERGIDIAGAGLATLDALWDEAKAAEAR